MGAVNVILVFFFMVLALAYVGWLGKIGVRKEAIVVASATCAFIFSVMLKIVMDDLCGDWRYTWITLLGVFCVFFCVLYCIGSGQQGKGA